MNRVRADPPAPRGPRRLGIGEWYKFEAEKLGRPSAIIDDDPGSAPEKQLDVGHFVEVDSRRLDAGFVKLRDGVLKPLT